MKPTFNFQYRVVCGRIHANPAYSYSERSDTHNAFFEIEYVDPRDKKNQTDLFKCVCFGKTAQAINGTFREGDIVIAEGQNRQFVKQQRDGTNTIEENFVVVRMTKICDAYNASGIHDTFDTQEIKFDRNVGGFNGFAEEFGETYTGRRGRRY